LRIWGSEKTESATDGATHLETGILASVKSPEEEFAEQENELTSAVREAPNDPEVWRKRGEFYLTHQRWAEAATDFDECFRQGLTDVWYRSWAALAHLMAGNRDTYIEYCDYISKHSANQKNNFAIRACSLISVTSVDYSTLLEVARNYAKDQPDKWWMAFGPGVVLYRLGRYPEALEVFQRAQSLAKQPIQLSTIKLWLAITYQQLGQSELAKKTLSEAKELSRSWLPGPGELLNIWQLFDFVECHFIGKEAEHLIGKVVLDSSQSESAN
jgi:tetratricopeptide (TPR) repeat protein